MLTLIEFSSPRSAILRGVLAVVAFTSFTVRAHEEPPSAAGNNLPASAGDLEPPKITILSAQHETARGLVFVAPKAGPGTTGQQGPEIVDDEGRPIWFHALAGGDQAADFRVQHYRSQPV